MVGTSTRQRTKKAWADWVQTGATARSKDTDINRLIADMQSWASPLMQPCRYKVLFGGRGSGKSWAISDALLLEGIRRPIRVLCGREFQVSIKDSVHHLLKRRIDDLGLGDYYEVQDQTIKGKRNGTSFIFKGLRHNISSIKSMSGISHCWIEEAQTISTESWKTLVPTIREPGSEIWLSFNPLNKSDPVFKEFVREDGQPKTRPNTYCARVNWSDNRFFPDVLNDERLAMAASDPDLYQHVWGGSCWEKADAQVLKGKWVIREFEVENWYGPYYGADWGYASDPTAAVELYIDGNTLYVYRESVAKALDIDATADKWSRDLPGIENYTVYADSASPASISYVRRHGIPRLKAAAKWQGSVNDGIAFLRSFDQIVIHPRCKTTIDEAIKWSYATDKLTGDVLPRLIDAHNHTWDAARYALSKLIRSMPDNAGTAAISPVAYGG